VYSLQENYPEALKSYLLAFELYKESNNEEGMAISHNNIGGMYIELKDYARAKQNLDSGLLLSNKLGIAENAKTSYTLLAELDSATGNWEEALRHHKSFILFRDSISGNETTNKLAKVQMQYDFDKKEEALKYQHLLTGEKLKQQTLLASQQQQNLLLKEQDLVLITNEKKLQQLEIEKDRAIFAGQKTEAAKKENQLILLSKEKSIQNLELNRQRIQKYYLIALLALFTVLSFFIYRSFRIRQQLKLQTLRNKIASDLHDDVGSTLSSISIFSQMAQQGSKEVLPLLETIGDSSRKMLDAMADIVWTINPENDQFEKIVLRMKNFAYDLLGAKNIDFEFITDEEITNLNLPMDVRKNLYLVFKEATNNMVKYSDANKALFSIKTERNILAMLISDNGKGFDTSRPSEGNGLKNMKKRAEEIGAKLSIEARPGNGTQITLKLAV
jgi:two-component system sensor histidine kinase UhpB